VWSRDYKLALDFRNDMNDKHMNEMILNSSSEITIQVKRSSVKRIRVYASKLSCTIINNSFREKLLRIAVII